MNGVTDKIVKYLRDNNIDIYKVAKDTGVPYKMLAKEGNDRLDAVQFLKLCSYLNISPEMFQNHDLL